jgi:hypothetical protein
MPTIPHFTALPSHPRERGTPWSEDVQGVTHDEDHWYITQKEHLWRIPVGLDLADKRLGKRPLRGEFSRSLASMGLTGYNHLGALDCHDGWLYVPVEPTPVVPPPGWPPHIPLPTGPGLLALFRADDLTLVASAPLPEMGNKAPWCAFCSQDGLLYSSLFDDPGEVLAFQVTLAGAQLTVSLQHRLRLRSERGAPMRVPEVQGGCFGPDGELYLCSNGGDDRGVLVFDRLSGRCLSRLPIETSWSTVGEELEGLTYWDLDDGRAPGVAGQLHVLELDNDVIPFGADEIDAFHHFRRLSEPAPRFVANRRPSSREVHREDCPWVRRMRPDNRVFYDDLARALADGFDGCHYCLPQFDHG